MTTPAERTAAIRAAFALEWATLAWLGVEAAVAIWSGAAAGSTSLMGFGLDSGIELASAGLLIWRLTMELRHGRAYSETAERLAARIGGGLLFGLAGYVMAAAGWSLWTRHGQDFSLPGLAVTLAALPLMILLARRKLTIAERIGSRALRTDAVESLSCAYLAAVVVAGLLAQLLTGFWWVDAVTSLGVVWFLVREGREAWSGTCCC